jgi:hypothetical protein
VTSADDRLRDERTGVALGWLALALEDIQAQRDGLGSPLAGTPMPVLPADAWLEAVDDLVIVFGLDVAEVVAELRKAAASYALRAAGGEP